MKTKVNRVLPKARTMTLPGIEREFHGIRGRVSYRADGTREITFTGVVSAAEMVLWRAALDNEGAMAAATVAALSTDPVERTVQSARADVLKAQAARGLDMAKHLPNARGHREVRYIDG